MATWALPRDPTLAQANRPSSDVDGWGGVER